jgi:hypothetical protein
VATNPNPALKAASGGKGPALIATTTANATGAAIHATSGSALPAVQTTGEVVAANGGTIPVAGNGAALTVQGVASFTRSGVATVAASTTSVVVSVPGGLSTTSHVLAMVQTNTTVWVKAAVPATSTGKITIYLNAAPSAAITVAWFVFG